MDPCKALHISRNPDGSLNRHPVHPISPPSCEEGEPVPNAPYLVLSKDINLNTEHKTWLRIFLPVSQQPAGAAAIRKLPIVIYFHGGAFIVLSAASLPFHRLCVRMAAVFPAVVVSAEHRLAPEHRLPAAYEDAMDTLLWLRTQARDSASADPWLRDHADFSRCFLTGTSSGGNIAYRIGLQSLALDLMPVTLAGLVLDQPFFGGEERTESEVRMAEDPVIPLAVTDLMWELSLPVGANRNHEYAGIGGGKGVSGLPRCLVNVCMRDPLVDRQLELASVLEKGGVSVLVRMDDDGFHGTEMFDPVKSDKYLADIKDFILSTARDCCHHP